MIIEPCCYLKQMDELIAGNPVVAHFFTNGDLSLTEYLDYFTGRCPGCDVFLALVSVSEVTLSAIVRMLDHKQSDGTPWVRSFTLLSQGMERTLVHRFLSPYMNQESRVLVCEDKASFRCLAVGNDTSRYVLNGSINQLPVYAMQMFTLTSSREAYEQAMSVFSSKKRTKKIK